MSLTVVVRDTALRSLARLRSDDKDLFTHARHTITQLADQPRPAGAVPWGGTGIYRLRPAVSASCTKSTRRPRPSSSSTSPPHAKAEHPSHMHHGLRLAHHTAANRRSVRPGNGYSAVTVLSVKAAGLATTPGA